MGKINTNIKSISSNSLKHLTKDKCLICNNKLDTSNTTVTTTCKRCGAVHTAIYDKKHNEEDTYTKVHVRKGANSLTDLTEDRCLICNNKLNYNNGKVLNLYKSNTTVSTICKRCGAIHTAKYEMNHDEEDRYTNVYVENGEMNIRVFSKYSGDIIANYCLYCIDVDATIPDEEGE